MARSPIATGVVLAVLAAVAFGVTTPARAQGWGASLDTVREQAELSRLLDRTGGLNDYTGVQNKALDLLLSPAVSTA